MNIQERISALEAEVAKLEAEVVKLKEGVNNKPDIEGAKKFILDKLNGSIFKLDGIYQIWSDVDGNFLFRKDKKSKVFYNDFFIIYNILNSDYRINQNEINKLVHSVLCEPLELNGYTSLTMPLRTPSLTGANYVNH